MGFDIVTSPPSKAELMNTDTTPTTNAELQANLGKVYDGVLQLDEALQIARVASVAGARNLVASATGSSASVSLTADEVVMVGAKYNLRASAVSLTINTAASGANGLDTGTLAINTWYALWVISNGTTVAGLISTSATAPTMPSGYTFKARVGWVRTDGTVNKYPLRFAQRGRRVQYGVGAGSNVTALPVAASGALGAPLTPTWSAVTISSLVPSTALSIEIVARVTGTSEQVMAAPSSSYGAVNSTTNPPPIGVGTNSSAASTHVVTGSFALESTTQIHYAGTANAGLHVLGWEDNLS